MPSKKNLSLILFVIFSIIVNNSFAQDTKESLAFKKNRVNKNNPYFYQPDLSYQLLQMFKLVQIANTGDPLAEHELGLRLLTGDGTVADTTTAVYWIKKAADQKLTSALYNYGVMLINGWGTEWNPFSAYEKFMAAAKAGMSQAQYVIGILNTDNLIVPRNWDEAYYWIKKSSDTGYEPAKEVIKDISTKVTPSFRDSVNQNKIVKNEQTKPTEEIDNSQISPSLGLVFIDFNSQTDTIKDIADKILIDDLDHIGINILLDSLSIKKDTSLLAINNLEQVNELRKLADAGSIEAQTILGRLYEKGIFVGKNDLLAAEFYIRATILDSPRSAFLLWNLIRKKNFYKILNDSVQFGDPSAQFIWYGLKKLGYDNRLTDADAINLLNKAVNQKHIPSMIELGFNYYTGKFIKMDKAKGIAIWELAKNFGSIEAGVRIATSQIYDSSESDPLLKNAIEVMEDALSKGSLLAEFTLGYCYESGKGFKKSIPSAVRFYREAAQRGNQYAYEQLKRLYDSIRPASEQFRVSN
jgi:TPR repeat protein